MTEEEWVGYNDPTPMLERLAEQASERKLRLFCVACCRRWWHLLDEEHCKKLVEVGVPLGCHELVDIPLNSCHKAIELAERAADESVSSGELNALSEPAFAFQFASEYYCACFDSGPFDGELVASGEAAFAVHNASSPHVSPAGVIWNTAQAAGYLLTKEFGPASELGMASERNCHCNILRDIFGNPFRPVTFDPRWLTSNVVDLATAIYDERAFEKMPILADALMDAGCDDEEIIAHCRGSGSHVRGCWVVDLLLGKA